MTSEYKISITLESKSIARIFWDKIFLGKIRTKKYLLGDYYEMKFKLKNVGENDFPGGTAYIQIDYTSSQRHHLPFQIPEIKKDGEYIIEKIYEKGSERPIRRQALGRDYALFYGKIVDKDDKPVRLIGYGHELLDRASFGSIFVETKTEVNNYYSLIIAAISLIFLIGFNIIRLLLGK